MLTILLIHTLQTYRSLTCFLFLFYAFIVFNESICIRVMHANRWRSEWQLAQLSKLSNGSDHRWPVGANHDVSDVGSWPTILRYSRFREPIFWVLEKPAIRFFGVGTKLRLPTRKVDGRGPSGDRIPSSVYKAILCWYYICKLWIKRCLFN